MKRWLFTLFVLFILVSCAGMPKLFQPPEPYCTVEEQKTSLIYKYLNPTDARFVLVGNLAYRLHKHPDDAPAIKRHLLTLEASVKEGVTYASLEKYVTANFGVFAGIVLSEALINFKGITVPLSECDKRMTLGAIRRLLEIVEMVQARMYSMPLGA